MKQYHDVLNDVLIHGTRQANRTGTDAISMPGHMMRFDMVDGFPAVTTKKLYFRKAIGENIAFLRGATTVKEFEDLGCDWWVKDANENSQWLASPHRKGEGDLGHIYGYQWRNWPNPGGKPIDQLQVVLDTIRQNPTSRRIIMTAWNPAELPKMALPPCHQDYQFIVNVERGELNLCMKQRSCDMFLGVPMNIFGSAMMLHLVAKATGLRARHLTMFLADAHIYVNHLDQVQEQLKRDPLPLPTIEIGAELLGCNADHLAAIQPHQIKVLNYQSHPAIFGEMSTA